ncbi:MAG: carboxypeptidase regulatory-like domain-containing protein [Gemmatimonadetes bacterium]|nr:carboxypeptidase regulatory-like domain-containing protein [Gemmatimonadota bacterium]
MRYPVIACMALSLALRAAPAFAQQDTQGGQAVPAAGQVLLTGVVLDATTGEPLRAARVRVPALHVDVFTDPDGRFIGPNVAPGSYGASVSLMGYGTVAQILAIGAGEPEPQVALRPNAVLLAALNVMTGRLERRARATGYTAMAFDRNLLVVSTEQDAAVFVREVAHITPVPCGAFATGAKGGMNCIRVRGVATPPCVLINDSPSTFGELAMYRPRELYRVEVYRGGAVIMAYTTAFAEEIAAHRYNPPPIEHQIQMMCRSGASLN